MINRTNVICDVCSEKFALRVTIGTLTGQKHKFPCPVCTSLLGYSFIFGYEQEGATETFINCKKEEGASFHASVINLHPDFVIPSDKLNDPKFSPNIYMLTLASDVYEADELEGLIDSDAIYELWKTIKIEWDLVDNEKIDILLKRYKEENLISEDTAAIELFYERLRDFLFNLNCFQSELVESLVPIVETAVNDQKDKVQKLLDYYDDAFFDYQMSLYKKALIKFFDGYSDLRQVRFPIQLNMDFTNHVITNYDFSTVEKIYAENFEILAKVIACLGFIMKINQGKEFDIFDNTNIRGYLAFSLQNKVKHLLTVASENFVPDENLIDNDLRNASSHGDMTIEPLSLIIKCTHGAKVFNVTYLEYLKLCWGQMDYLSQLAIHDLNLKKLITTIKTSSD